MNPTPLFVLGRYPPPTDGQTVATERVASLLEAMYEVRRLDTQAPAGRDPLSGTSGFDLRRTLHYVSTGLRHRRALAAAPAAPVLWPSISSAPLGHLRDVVTVAPTFRRGQPVVGVLHGAGFEGLFESPLAATARRLVARLDAVVFLSPALAEPAAPFVPDAKRHVIPNTIRDGLAPTPEAVEDRLRAGPGRPFQVLFLSNMIREKGYLDVLAATARLAGDGADVRAHFVGRWPDEPTRREFLAEATRVGDRVRVHGIVTDLDALRRLYLDADVLALPTTYPLEALPTVLLEALGSGTPIVTVDRPEMRAIVTDGAEGRLVAPHAPEAVAAAIADLMAPNAWRAAGAAARRRYEEAFAPDAVRDRWVNLIESLPSHAR